jgi:molybdopterin converting factor subunit 1
VANDPLRSGTGSDYGVVMRVLLFAAAREAVGQAAVDVDVANVAGEVTVAVVRAKLLLQWPSLQRVLAQSRIAVDHRFVSDHEVVSAGQEVAIIPPVAGG